MRADLVRIECALQDDPRLLAGVPVIVSHAARNAGIPKEEREKLAAATLAACRRAFDSAEKSGRGSVLRLLVDRFADRVEVTIEHVGKSRPNPELRGLRSTTRGSRTQARADRAQHPTRDGFSQTKLVSYCDALDSKSAE
jgi:hypothetical protein